MEMGIRWRTRRGTRRLLLPAAVCLVIGSTMTFSLPGCGGCRKTAAQRQKEADEEKEEKRKREKEKEKENFETSETLTLPDHNLFTRQKSRTTRGSGLSKRYYKPGHWTATAVTAKANKLAFVGELQMASSDRDRRPLPVPATPFYFNTFRQAALPKGQWKTFESVVFPPPCESSTTVSGRLNRHRGGRAAMSFWDGALKMPSYQYHFIVLARWPSRYLYLQGLDAIEAGTDGMTSNKPYYHVSLIKSGKRAPLPSHSLCWTSTAYVLWDDAEPTTLDLQQQEAMIDWLHWGGQLILSGPDTLDTLKGSFLEPYLPATAATGGRKIDAEDFETFRQWSENKKNQWPQAEKKRLDKKARDLETEAGNLATEARNLRNEGRQQEAELKQWEAKRKRVEAEKSRVEAAKLPEAFSLARLRLAKPWTGVVLQPQDGARFIPESGNLAVERQIGSGRVVATAFRLGSPSLKVIPGGDEFFNAFLLRRPARKFVVHEFPETTGSAGEQTGYKPALQDSATAREESEFEVRWDKAGHRLDARHTTKVRYFTRDTGASRLARAEKQPGGIRRAAGYGEDTRGSDELDDFSVDSRQSGPGLAAWNDFSEVACRARHTLKAAAEIEIPKPDFVIWVVAGYLLVLVPANWLVFRAINRVEWAWVAAPLIAVGCTILVIHLAQLDIGFARSRTEIAVVEVQSNYDRAHVTRYTAMYTSLGTRYDFELENPGAAVLPFPTVDSLGEFKMKAWQRHRELIFRRGEHVRLEHYPVLSNTTGMVHSEQVVDLGGALSLVKDSNGAQQVTNRTRFPIREASVVRLDKPGGELKVAWLGTLEPGESKPLEWRLQNGGDILGEHRRGSILTGRAGPRDRLHLGPLVELAEKKETLRAGETRLIGTITEEIAGMDIRPAAPQTRRAILVVAHLGFGYGEAPQPDANTAAHPAKILENTSFPTTY